MMPHGARLAQELALLADHAKHAEAVKVAIDMQLQVCGGPAVGQATRRREEVRGEGNGERRGGNRVERGGQMDRVGGRVERGFRGVAALWHRMPVHSSNWCTRRRTSAEASQYLHIYLLCISTSG